MTRERLPNKRATTHSDFELSGIKYTVSWSRFADGRLGEIFIFCPKAGTAADIAARDAAIACSLALQFGADMDTIRKALCRDARGNASGPLAAALDVIAGQA